MIEDSKVSIEEEVFNHILQDWADQVQSIDVVNFQKL